MQSQGIKGKYIKQIKLAGSKNYFPNRFFSPYEFMDELNKVVVKKYDIRVVEVKYIISRSKHMKDMDDHTYTNIDSDEHFNNIFSIEDDFLKQLMADAVLLVPPDDFDANKFDMENNALKKQFEEKKNNEIDLALKLLADIQLAQNIKDWKNVDIRSLQRFKKEIGQSLKESQVDIYIKVVLSKPTEDKIESDKNSKSPITIMTNSKQEVRVYLHPVKSDPESEDLIAKICPITDWDLCSLNPDQGNKAQGNTYWSINQISKKVHEINASIKIMSYIAIHRNKKGNLDYLEIYSFLFNEIVLRTVVNLAQIKKIEVFESKQEKAEDAFSQFYLHLVYPPKYYMAILKPDIGCDDGFIRNWERIENFTFLRNPKIMKDEFLRLYLFNNTVLKVRLCKNDFDINIDAAKNLLFTTISQFKGVIKNETLRAPYDLGRKLTHLNTIFKYENFKTKFHYNLTESFPTDKIWKLKYLMLVMVRYNQMAPSEIQNILSYIDKAREDIDIFVYIFWQSVTLLNTVAAEVNAQEYQPYLEKEYNQIKKLSIADITRKVSANTELISYVFKASLTPSGYLYNPPTPEMKGRLMKEYSTQSQHFMRVTITDDNEGTLKNQKYITKVALKGMMQKIPILERLYIPLGWSPSQLRSYSLWYIHQVTFNRTLIRQQVLSFLGYFDDIPNPAKKAARIGQAFSASWTLPCKNGEIKEFVDPDDRSSKNYLYTDGIGKISPDLLQKISLKLQIKDLSVVQIRYKGAKGILVLDDSLPPKTIRMRNSMIKYECKHDSAEKYLDILDWNKYKAGFLNRQTIILLKSLGIADLVFVKKHNEHIQKISSLSFKDCSIFKHMNEELNTDICNLEPANVTILHLLRAGFRLEDEPFFRGVLETMKKNGYHQLKVKSNIMIEQSARIIGIIDEWNILEEGELYCCVVDNLSLKPFSEHVQGDVVITRNPCLHPADIRKMKCVSNLEIAARFQKRGEDNILEKYVNCVIFPKKGEIPVTSQISGSDLDGDNFFICWDKELIPLHDEPIYVIDAPVSAEDKGKKEVKKITQEEMYNEMLDFFVEYLNYEKLGQIDNSHLVHADRSPFYAKAKECMELAIAHGKAVDFPKSGFCPQIDPKLLVSVYPDFMEKEESLEYFSESILGNLYRDIKQRIKNLLSSCETHKTGKIDDKLLQQLITSENFVFESTEIRQVIEILMRYERQLSSLITLAGVDTQYEIYSGNFSIAKDKVKAFGKNRLIATILALRSKYFDEFFNDARSLDKDIYNEAKELDLESLQIFSPETRKRAMLFYACSYLMKYYQDEDFLNEQHFRPLRERILHEFRGMSWERQGKFCGFVWFVIPKIIINQKYRIRKMEEIKKKKGIEEEDVKEFGEDEEEVI